MKRIATAFFLLSLSTGAQVPDPIVGDSAPSPGNASTPSSSESMETVTSDSLLAKLEGMRKECESLPNVARCKDMVNATVALEHYTNQLIGIAADAKEIPEQERERIARTSDFTPENLALIEARKQRTELNLFLVLFASVYGQTPATYRDFVLGDVTDPYKVNSEFHAVAAKLSALVGESGSSLVQTTKYANYIDALRQRLSGIMTVPYDDIEIVSGDNLRVTIRKDGKNEVVMHGPIDVVCAPAAAEGQESTCKGSEKISMKSAVVDVLGQKDWWASIEKFNAAKKSGDENTQKLMNSAFAAASGSGVLGLQVMEYHLDTKLGQALREGVNSMGLIEGLEQAIKSEVGEERWTQILGKKSGFELNEDQSTRYVYRARAWSVPHKRMFNHWQHEHYKSNKKSKPVVGHTGLTPGLANMSQAWEGARLGTLETDYGWTTVYDYPRIAEGTVTKSASGSGFFQQCQLGKFSEFDTQLFVEYPSGWQMKDLVQMCYGLMELHPLSAAYLKSERDYFQDRSTGLIDQTDRHHRRNDNKRVTGVPFDVNGVKHTDPLYSFVQGKKVKEEDFSVPGGFAGHVTYRQFKTNKQDGRLRELAWMKVLDWRSNFAKTGREGEVNWGMFANEMPCGHNIELPISSCVTNVFISGEHDLFKKFERPGFGVNSFGDGTFLNGTVMVDPYLPDELRASFTGPRAESVVSINSKTGMLHAYEMVRRPETFSIAQSSIDELKEKVKSRIAAFREVIPEVKASDSELANLALNMHWFLPSVASSGEYPVAGKSVYLRGMLALFSRFKDRSSDDIDELGKGLSDIGRRINQYSYAMDGGSGFNISGMNLSYKAPELKAAISSVKGSSLNSAGPTVAPKIGALDFGSGLGSANLGSAQQGFGALRAAAKSSTSKLGKDFGEAALKNAEATFSAIKATDGITSNRKVASTIPKTETSKLGKASLSEKGKAENDAKEEIAKRAKEQGSGGENVSYGDISIGGTRNPSLDQAAAAVERSKRSIDRALSEEVGESIFGVITKRYFYSYPRLSSKVRYKKRSPQSVEQVKEVSKELKGKLNMFE